MQALYQTTHETSDHYAGVIVRLCPRQRVIVCKDGIQWVIQQRKRGGGEWPWRALGYFRTRKALIRFTANLRERAEPAAWATLAALPDKIGGS